MQRKPTVGAGASTPNLQSAAQKFSALNALLFYKPAVIANTYALTLVMWPANVINGSKKSLFIM